MSLITKFIKFLKSNTEKVPYWVEIKTQKPICTYYFGPFDSLSEAKAMQPDYIEDLLNENAQIIAVEIKQCEPTELTILEEEEFF
jgi:hypothetical protein